MGSYLFRSVGLHPIKADFISFMRLLYPPFRIAAALHFRQYLALVSNGPGLVLNTAPVIVLQIKLNLTLFHPHPPQTHIPVKNQWVEILYD